MFVCLFVCACVGLFVCVFVLFVCDCVVLLLAVVLCLFGCVGSLSYVGGCVLVFLLVCKVDMCVCSFVVVACLFAWYCVFG